MGKTIADDAASVLACEYTRLEDELLLLNEELTFYTVRLSRGDLEFDELEKSLTRLSIESVNHGISLIKLRMHRLFNRLVSMARNDEQGADEEDGNSMTHSLNRKAINTPTREKNKAARLWTRHELG